MARTVNVGIYKVKVGKGEDPPSRLPHKLQT
jgi:hypothetical protein